METETQLVTRDTELALPEPSILMDKLQAINEFQQIVHANLILGQDYGVIPGTTKPTLLKPGAEKIAKLLNLADEYEILDSQEDWVSGFFRYMTKCRLRHISSGAVVSEGLGECNSMEAKYRWRETKRVCPHCGADTIIKGKKEYGGGWLCFKKQGGCGSTWTDGDKAIESQSTGRVENDDIYSQVNTLLKMSKKRALVDAALSAGRLSNIFTQDIEDMPSLKTSKKAVDVAPEPDESTDPLTTTISKVAPATAKERKPSEFKSIATMREICRHDFRVTDKQIEAELGEDSMITKLPYDCYLQIKAVYGAEGT